MKRVLTISILSLCVFALCSCAKTKSSGKATATSPASEPTTQVVNGPDGLPAVPDGVVKDIDQIVGPYRIVVYRYDSEKPAKLVRPGVVRGKELQILLLNAKTHATIGDMSLGEAPRELWMFPEEYDFTQAKDGIFRLNQCTWDPREANADPEGMVIFSTQVYRITPDGKLAADGNAAVLLKPEAGDAGRIEQLLEGCFREPKKNAKGDIDQNDYDHEAIGHLRNIGLGQPEPALNALMHVQDEARRMDRQALFDAASIAIAEIRFAHGLADGPLFGATDVERDQQEKGPWLNWHRGDPNLAGVLVQQFPDCEFAAVEYAGKRHPISISYVFKDGRWHSVDFSPDGTVQTDVWSTAENDDFVWKNENLFERTAIPPAIAGTITAAGNRPLVIENQPPQIDNPCDCNTPKYDYMHYSSRLFLGLPELDPVVIMTGEAKGDYAPIITRQFQLADNKWVLLGWSSTGDETQTMHAVLVGREKDKLAVVDHLKIQTDRASAGLYLQLNAPGDSTPACIGIPEWPAKRHNPDDWTTETGRWKIKLADLKRGPAPKPTGRTIYYGEPMGLLPQPVKSVGWIAIGTDGFHPAQTPAAPPN